MEQRIKMNAKEIQAFWKLNFWKNLYKACPGGVFFVVHAMIESKMDKMKAKFLQDFHRNHGVSTSMIVSTDVNAMEFKYDDGIIETPAKKKKLNKAK